MREILRVSKICTNLDRSITCSWISTSERQLHILTSRLYRTSSITSTTSRWLSMQFSLSVELLDIYRQYSHLTLGASTKSSQLFDHDQKFVVVFFISFN